MRLRLVCHKSILENWMLVILCILNDDLHVHHVKHISTCSGCTLTWHILC